MKRSWIAITVLTFAVLALLQGQGFAQSSVRPKPRVVASCGTPPYTYLAGQDEWATQDTSGKACVNATVSATATIAPFQATPGYANLTATNVSARVALPTGTTVIAYNTGTTVISCTVGTVSVVATTNMDQIQPGGQFTYNPSGTQVDGACIDQTGSTSNVVVFSGGAGQPAAAGGGSSAGSGSNSSVSATGSAVPASGTYAGMNVAGNLTGLTGTANGLKVDGSAVTQPVSGSISLTGATNNINNVAGTISLPTGAATAANQPTNSAIAATTSGQTGNIVMGAVTTGAPTYTTAQTDPLSLDTAGNLRVNVVAGAAGGTSYAQASTTAGQNVSPAGCAVTTSSPTYTTAQTNPVSCDTTGALRVNVISATGVAQASTTSGQSISPIGGRTLNASPSDTTAQTNLPVLDLAGNLRVATSASPYGGATTFNLTAAASTNATNIKASAGSLYHISAYNNSSTMAWVSFYNTAGTPTCGTSVVWQTMIPANSTSGAGAVEDIATPINFSTGIGICVTTGIAGTGGVAASTYVVNLGFK